MKIKKITTAFLFALFVLQVTGQSLSSKAESSGKGNDPFRKFSLSTTYLTFANFGAEKTNTHHYEFHLGYRLSPKDKIGIKVASWKLFAPMGIQLWDDEFLQESEFFPGRLSEKGIGLTYQRFLWKGLFATAEVLPLLKTYLNEDQEKIGDGFKLYTTWHLGYHIPLFKDRLYIEPQLHCNYWAVDTKAPQAFQERESKWKNYFLFEPNIYIGFNF